MTNNYSATTLFLFFCFLDFFIVEIAVIKLYKHVKLKVGS